MHDVSDGGLLVAVAEMALAGAIGVQLFPYEGKLPAHAAWFGEDQARYVLEAEPGLVEEIIERARLLALPARVVARVGGDALTLKTEPALALDDLRKAHEGWLPGYMGSTLPAPCPCSLICSGQPELPMVAFCETISRRLTNGRRDLRTSCSSTCATSACASMV